MNFKMQKLVGNIQIIFEGDAKGFTDFFQKASAVCNFPDVCGNCGAKDLSFQHRQPKGFDYYSILCNACRHELQYGQLKEGKGLYQKGWQPPYQSDNTVHIQSGNAKALPPKDEGPPPLTDEEVKQYDNW